MGLRVKRHVPTDPRACFKPGSPVGWARAFRAHHQISDHTDNLNETAPSSGSGGFFMDGYFGAFDGDVVGTGVPPLPRPPCRARRTVSVLRLAYASLSPRRRSRRYLFLYRGHLPAPADSLRRTGAGGLARCGGYGPRETSVHDRCVDLATGSSSLFMDLAAGRRELCFALRPDQTVGVVGLRRTLSPRRLDVRLQNQTP
jgi:hypothetical protein